MKTRGLMFWFVLMIILYGVIFSFNSDITGKAIGDICDINNPCEDLSHYCFSGFCVEKEGLVLHYDFDNGNAVDSSYFGNDGTIYGDGIFVDDNLVGKAISLYSSGGGFGIQSSEDDYIDSGNSEVLQISKNITVMAWIKVPEITDGKSKMIAQKYSADDDSGWLFLVDENGYIKFDGRDGSENYHSVKSKKSRTSNYWHHVSGVRAGSVWKLYVDGVLSDLKDAVTKGDISAPNVNLWIGNYLDSGMNFKGAIDEFKIYNYALNDDRVYNEYKKRFKGRVLGSLDERSSTGLVVYVDGASASGKEYDSVKTISINKLSWKQALAEFEHDFSRHNLNLSNIYVRHQLYNENRGWTFVHEADNEIKNDKIIYVKDLHSMNHICIKDSNSENISLKINGCNENNNKLLECDGDVSNGYNCTDLGDFYKVKDLKHSTVIELNCAESWSCTEWKDSGKYYQRRTCVDNNVCGTDIYKPEERKKKSVTSKKKRNVKDDLIDYGSGSSGNSVTGGEGGGGTGYSEFKGAGSDSSGSDYSEVDVGGEGTEEDVKVEKPKGGLDIKIILLIVVIFVWFVFMLWFFWLRKRKKKLVQEGMFKKKKKPKVKTPIVPPKNVPKAPKKEIPVKEKNKTPTKDVSDELPW